MLNDIIEQKIDKYSRKTKRNFTNAYWIHQSQFFLYMHKNEYKSKSIVDKIYNQKHRCVKAMIESGENEVKIYRPCEDTYRWLIVVENELEGFRYNLVIPYHLVDISIFDLEETDLNRDCLFLDGKEIDTVSTNMNKGRNLRFCLENMEKSRLKLLETI